MNPIVVPIVIELVQAIIANAPTIIDGVAKAKAAIQGLFTAGVIDAAQQNATDAYVDSIAALVAVGVPPSHWQVEADPA